MVWQRVSNNNEYIIRIEGLNKDEDRYKIRQYRTSDAEMVDEFVVNGDHCIAVSDDGKRVATAIWGDYAPGHVYVYEDGKEVLHLTDYTRIGDLDFKDNDHLVVGEKNKTYILDLTTRPVQVEKENYLGLVANPYGEDIVWKNETKVFIGGQGIKCSTFRYFGVIAIKGGVVVSEVANRPICYDMTGKKLWEADSIAYGQVDSMVYDPSDEVIYGIASLSEVDKLTHNIVMIDAHTGKVISAFEVSDGLGEIVNVKGEFFLFGFDGSIFRITKQGLVDTSKRLKGIQDEIKEYIDAHRATPAKALIFEDHEEFLNMLYDRDIRITKIVWHEYCRNGEQQIGFWSIIESEDSDYIWAETDLTKMFSKEDTLDEILEYIENTRKEYDQHQLYPEFIINCRSRVLPSNQFTI
jgi:hypothetical protein